jgi:hypothetical protein
MLQFLELGRNLIGTPSESSRLQLSRNLSVYLFVSTASLKQPLYGILAPNFDLLQRFVVRPSRHIDIRETLGRVALA